MPALLGCELLTAEAYCGCLLRLLIAVAYDYCSYDSTIARRFIKSIVRVAPTEGKAAGYVAEQGVKGLKNIVAIK
jgi:hypothetical protein